MDKVWICVDCAYRSEYSEKQTEEHELDYNVARKLQQAKPELFYNSDGELEMTDFSKSHCGFCGSSLAGTRIAAHLLKGE